MHWQNLNDPDSEGRRRRWLHGRTWVGGWSIEWCLPDSFALSLTFQMPGLHFAGAHLSLCLFGLYLSHSRRDFGGIRRVNFSWHDGTLRFTPWSREMEWRATDPWWVKGLSFNPSDFLLGKQRHAHTVHGDYQDVLIPMPEGCYPARMRPEERTWKRPRWPWWPFTVRHLYMEIELPGGIPFEGKGENSWDCGEDGLWGCSSSSWSVEKAVGHVVETVLKDRKRYGGSWIHRGRPAVMATPRERPA